MATIHHGAGVKVGGKRRRAYSSAFLIKRICNYVSSFIAKYFCIISLNRLVDDNFDVSRIHYTFHSCRHYFASSDQSNWYNWHSGFYCNAECTFLQIVTARQKLNNSEEQWFLYL